jgi:serine/threonine-protein kinase
MVNSAMSPESQAPEAALFEGTQYRLVAPFAKGGMGDLYLVENRTSGCQWVAKVVHEALASDPQLVDRVRIEAQSLGNLRHPNIVCVIDSGNTSDRRPFIVMEYLKGNDLGRELASGRLFSLEEILRYADEALAGIGAAHQQGIIHRDLKPENLFLHEHDGKRTLKILDFGVARIVPGIAPQSAVPLAYSTGTGLVVGTLKYLSPEGAVGLTVDFRADIYSIGLVLYRMLAGRGPYPDDLSDSDLIALRLTQPPKPPSYFAPRPIAAQLDRVVLKALQISPNDRYQTASEFSEALREVRSLSLEFASSSEPVPIALSLRRHERTSDSTRSVGPLEPSGSSPEQTTCPSSSPSFWLRCARYVPASFPREYAAIIVAALVFAVLLAAIAMVIR